jgi:hypothetical protein
MGFIAAALDALIALDKPFQVGLKSSAQPFGPGIVRREISDEQLAAAEPIDRPFLRGYYRITVQATQQADARSRPIAVNIPIVFHVDDVLVALLAPEPTDQPLVVSPGRGSGGLHIPGGS